MKICNSRLLRLFRCTLLGSSAVVATSSCVVKLDTKPEVDPRVDAPAADEAQFGTAIERLDVARDIADAAIEDEFISDTTPGPEDEPRTQPRNTDDETDPTSNDDEVTEAASSVSAHIVVEGTPGDKKGQLSVRDVPFDFKVGRRDLAFLEKQWHDKVDASAYHSSTEATSWRVGVYLGARIRAGTTEFAGAYTLASHGVLLADEVDDLRADVVAGNVQRLWKSKQARASSVRFTGSSARSNAAPVECLVYDHGVNVAHFDDDWAKDVGSKALGWAIGRIPVPGASMLGSAVTNAARKFLGAGGVGQIGLVNVICADRKRYVGAFNLPVAIVEGVHRGCLFGCKTEAHRRHDTITFYGPSSSTESDPPGYYSEGGSGPLLHRNYFEAED